MGTKLKDANSLLAGFFVIKKEIKKNEEKNEINGAIL